MFYGAVMPPRRPDPPRPRLPTMSHLRQLGFLVLAFAIPCASLTLIAGLPAGATIGQLTFTLALVAVLAKGA